jgi:hypothetical protein
LDLEGIHLLGGPYYWIIWTQGAQNYLVVNRIKV